MIITINREFGSGGRELGKRLADALGIPCYDHQIIEMIAKNSGFDENYVANVSEKSIETVYPMTIGHHFSVPAIPFMDQSIRVSAEQRKILEGFARQGDCVIVGRCADVILQDYQPLKIFVYADTEAKVRRCMERAKPDEHLTENDVKKHIKRIDKERAQYRQMYSDTRWGDKESYHLCVNTSGREIKTLIPALAQLCRDWFGEQ